MLSARLAGIYARAPLGIHLGLDAMREVCARVGDPQDAAPSIHVAGTNGKGSVCAMVEAMARAAGRRTGLYTSPHLCRFAERIRVDGEPIDDDALEAALGQALDEGPDLSFFEVATLAAFLAFHTAKVDLAIVEVGLGGRLDATNVIARPRATAITRIAFDHTDMLGDSLVAIAGEKAGIAKAGVELVVGPSEPDVLRAIEEAARGRGARVTLADGDPAAARLVQNTRIGLAGAHQESNARIAALLGARIGLSDEHIREGLTNVRWPARLERVPWRGTTALLDAAHNVDGAKALADHLRTLGLPPARVALVFGALADKAWQEMVDVLAPLAGARYFAPPRGRAAVDPHVLAARSGGTAFPDAASACEAALAVPEPPSLVVVAGSIYLVGEARAHLLELPRDPVVAL